MMEAIREQYPCLSGQFGKSSETIELHDYDDPCSTATINSLKKIVNDVFKDQNHSYRVEESRAKSKLLKEQKYEEAIKKADFELLATVIEAVRLHDTVYNCN